MFTWQYILSQVFVVLAMISLGLTFLIKNKKIILLLSTLSVLFFAFEFLLLGSITGLVLNIVSVFRGIWFYFNEKYNKEKDWFSFIIISVLLIITGCFSIKIWLDYLAIVATVLYTFSIWQKNLYVYRFLAVLGSIFWLSYNITYFSILGMICETCLLIFEITGVILLFTKKNKKEVV